MLKADPDQEVDDSVKPEEEGWVQVGTAVGVLIYETLDISANNLKILVETDLVILVEGGWQLQ